jgi:catechol 2,3-dioxygenase-like lactoylglutathione lyase family enzyme
VTPRRALHDDTHLENTSVRAHVLAASLLGLSLAAGPIRGETPPAAPEVALKRVNLLVRDMQRSLAIYRDVLGFRVFQCNDSSPQSFSYPVFRIPAEAKLHFCTLDSSTEVRALALTEVRGVELPPPPQVQLSAPVIRVTRIDEVTAKLKAAGLDVVEPRRSRTAEGHEFTELAFTDPDGHVVVLYELD